MMNEASSKNRAACIWLANWPLQRACSNHPESKPGPVILYEQYRRGSFRVVACSPGHGIKPGMSLAEATALAGAHLEEHDPAADRAAIAQLAAWCEQFSPIVGLEEPDNLLLDVTGLGPLFGGEYVLTEQIVRAFRRRGLATQVAIADTVGAAWALAHYGKKVSDTFSIVPSGKTDEALANLPIAALRLADETIAILSELGIEQISQLLALPRDALASRFDPQLLIRLNQAIGLMPEAITSHRPPPEFTAHSLLEFPTANREALDHILAQLMTQITRSLLERQQGVIQLECYFQCEVGQPIRIHVGLFRASADAKHLLELTRTKLDRLTLPALITAVKLSVLTSAPLTSWQPSLFDDQSQREGRRQTALLVDRLASRLGRQSVVRAVAQPDAQPEFAFRYEPLTGVAPKRGRESMSSANRLRNKKGRESPQLSLVRVLPRPLRLEHEPIPLEVLSVVPNGPPIQFHHQGHWRRIAQTWGPERIQTGWWRGRYVQRDYYRVEITAGTRFWLFRRLADGKWFLHGVFD
jgi:protein ImuB